MGSPDQKSQVAEWSCGKIAVGREISGAPNERRILGTVVEIAGKAPHRVAVTSDGHRLGIDGNPGVVRKRWWTRAVK